MSNSTATTAGMETQKAKKFGMFLGVYTPSVLTILGAMMYMRFGWVLGNLGLPMTLITVCLACGITAITALSASAIATNMRVGVGGEYFMISRSLGLELGGAIGIPLFLCRTLSITLYSFALAEAVVPGASTLVLMATAAIIIFIVTLISGKSAELSLKLQIPIMILVGISLFALAGGTFSGGFRAPEMTATFRTAETKSFWYVFAVFFPAATGFTAGIGMSGDLKDPQRYIPKGTMLAVLTGWLVYVSVPFLLAVSSRASFDELAQQGLSWDRVALLGSALIIPGMWGAILSSAFGSSLGGPRVLQALAVDGVAPKFLAKVSKTGQPTVATWATGAIALAAVLLGDLNAVASWVTIFFLTLYVMINLSAALERLVGDPSYRPTIAVPWWLSLLGALGALSVMFLIKWWVCLVAIVVELFLWLWFRSISLQRQWGDVRAGFWMALARLSLWQLRANKPDARNWRPHIMVFSGNLSVRINLARLASWFNQDRGVLTVCDVIAGRSRDLVEEIPRRRRALDNNLEDHGINAFGEVDVVKDFESGVVDIIQANGIAGLQSNTIMMGFPRRSHRLVRQLRIMRAAAALNKSMILARLEDDAFSTEPKRIDVWWRGLQNNGDLMLLLAYLLNLNYRWRGAKIVLRSIVSDLSRKQFMQDSMNKLIADARISANAEVIVKMHGQSPVDIIHNASSDADLVFMGLNIPEDGQEEDYAKRMYELAEGLGNIVFVRNNSPFAGKLV